jgi:hypothetical protein
MTVRPISLRGKSNAAIVAVTVATILIPADLLTPHRADAYVQAHTAKVVSLTRVFLKSTADAKEACHAAELYYRMTWRCEGWWGGTCVRRSLTRPNHVWCGSPARSMGAQQQFFMSSFDGRRHLDVWRSALYYAGANGSSVIRLVRGTSKWRSRVTSGGEPT